MLAIPVNEMPTTGTPRGNLSSVNVWYLIKSSRLLP
jgi:hypothetical protein